HEHHAEQDQRDGARRQHEQRQRGSEPASSGPEREQREQREGDAERERELAGDQDSRPDDGERPDRPACGGSPLVLEEERERTGGERHGEHGEEPDPEYRSERVVEDAVADEGVPPGVPEVVPEREAVYEEERPLVLVRGEVSTRWGEPHEQ